MLKTYEAYRLYEQEKDVFEKRLSHQGGFNLLFFLLPGYKWECMFFHLMPRCISFPVATAHIIYAV